MSGDGTTGHPAPGKSTLSRLALPVLVAPLLGVGILSALHAPGARAGEPGHLVVPAPVLDPPPSGARVTETAVFSGGCFWGIQGVFQHVKGVERTLAGYDGGPAASYEEVSTGATGNAESVQVVFDPRVVSYGTLMRIFFSVALDPTQVNAQYPDEGTQYRSVLFTTGPEQRRIASSYVAQLDAAHVFAAPIATEVVADHGFHPAEGYHQNYLEQNPGSPYIQTFDVPKVEALRTLFPSDYRADPQLQLASD